MLDPVTTEALRVHRRGHTAATILLVQGGGVDSRTVMELMGWSTVAMLARYQHVIDELRSDAASKVGSWRYREPGGDNWQPLASADDTSREPAHGRN